MKQIYKSSRSGSLNEALSGISAPNLLILMSNEKQFDQHVAELEKAFPGVPSIGCIGTSYEKNVTEGGVAVTAFTGVETVTGVLRSVMTMPVRDIKEFEDKLRSVRPDSKNTVCMD